MRSSGGEVYDAGVPGWSDRIFHRRRALAYVAGAWMRYGHEDRFGFANAKDKAQLIAVLLEHLGCTGVSVESTVGVIPQGNTVHFTPTAEVTEWLNETW